MKIHHLNCGTICAVGGRLVSGKGGIFEKACLVCHCLLIETDSGLVLVDTGFGTADVSLAPGRLPLSFRSGLISVRLDPNETAIRQIERLGFRPGDVRHIVVTHLDPDHAGGLSDFPAAKVHLFAEEHRAASARATLNERMRYRPSHWAHGPDWELHSTEAGERWFGFEKARPLPGIAPELLLIPLHGHTRGHGGVAVDSGAGWLLHAGDAYFHSQELTGASAPLGLELFEGLLAVDGKARRANLGRLRELAASKDRQVQVFCAHDPDELVRF